MEDPRTMSEKEIRDQIEQIENWLFKRESQLLADPGPAEEANDRAEDLYQELSRRGIAAPHLGQMLRF